METYTRLEKSIALASFAAVVHGGGNRSVSELDLFDRTTRDFLTEEIMSSIATTSHSLLLNGSRTR
jgi:hypothetical protein